MNNDSKEFILPEKWCIRWGSKEKFEVIQKYMIENGYYADSYYTDERIHSKALVTYQNIYYGATGYIPDGHTEITYEQFRKYVLKKETMKINIKEGALRWTPKITEELFEEIVKAAEAAGYKRHTHYRQPCSYESVKYYQGIGNTPCINISENHYKKNNSYIGKCIVVDNNTQALNPITLKDILQEETMEKRIIGYKSPIDMFNGEAPKGTLFVKTKWSKDFYGFGDNAKTTSYSRHLPKELVETWEPVYESDFKVGEWIISENSLTPTAHRIKEVTERLYVVEAGLEMGFPKTDTSLRLANINEVLKSPLKTTIGGYTVNLGGYKKKADFNFGCQNVNKSDIEFLVSLLENKDANASIRIKGEEVTLDSLKKLLMLV